MHVYLVRQTWNNMKPSFKSDRFQKTCLILYQATESKLINLSFSFNNFVIFHLDKEIIKSSEKTKSHDPSRASRSSWSTPHQPFWLQMGYSLIPVKLSELPDGSPRVTHSSKYFPFAISLLSIESPVSLWNISNEFPLNLKLSDERRSCQSGSIKVCLCANPSYLWERVEALFPLSICLYCAHWPKNCQQKKMFPSWHKWWGEVRVILICINSVLYWSKHAVSLKKCLLDWLNKSIPVR